MQNQLTCRRACHPAVSILSWIVFALAVEMAAPERLPILAFAAGLLVLPEAPRKRLLRLLWKSRVLWIMLIVIYAWTVPGRFVWPAEWSPTYEGLIAGGIRVTRLFLMLTALARLLTELPPPRLAAGIYLLAKPFSWLGLDRRALAVRLTLTLEQLEHLPKMSNWLDRLNTQPKSDEGRTEMLLEVPELAVMDMLVLVSSLALLGLVSI